MTGPISYEEKIYGGAAEKRETATPLTMAIAELGKRCVIKHGCYYIDGFPATMHQLIEKANEMRKERGEIKPLKLSKWQ